jgi:hypothetical protein
MGSRTCLIDFRRVCSGDSGEGGGGYVEERRANGLPLYLSRDSILYWETWRRMRSCEYERDFAV